MSGRYVVGVNVLETLGKPTRHAANAASVFNASLALCLHSVCLQDAEDAGRLGFAGLPKHVDGTGEVFGKILFVGQHRVVRPHPAEMGPSGFHLCDGGCQLPLVKPNVDPSRRQGNGVEGAGALHLLKLPRFDKGVHQRTQAFVHHLVLDHGLRLRLPTEQGSVAPDDVIPADAAPAGHAIDSRFGEHDGGHCTTLPALVAHARQQNFDEESDGVGRLVRAARRSTIRAGRIESRNARQRVR